MNTRSIPLEALQRAVSVLGGQSAMARLCNVTQGAVWRWVKVTGQLPSEMVLRVEAATGVSRHDLRPDIYPVNLPPAPPSWNALDQETGRADYVEPRCLAPDNNTPSSTDLPIPSTKPRRPSGR